MKLFYTLILAALLPLMANAYDAEIDGIYYNFSGNEATVTYATTSYNSYSGAVVIPESVTYNNKTYSVTSIGDCAFVGCSGLTSITIPNSVTNIGERAFLLCDGLTSITIPNSVTSIGDYAFDGCSGLTSVTIPGSVTSIGEGAFYACEGLTSVTILDGVTSIGDYAFYGCSSLTSVTIPGSVTSIGGSAFYGCSSLTSITIPNSVTSIGNYAFYDCSRLTSVNMDIDTPLAITENTFSNRENATLIVPNGCMSAYEAAAYWNEFKYILEGPNAITIGSSGYGTFCSSQPMDLTDISAFKAYIVSGFNPETSTLVLTRVTEVPAGEGLYIVGTPGTYDVPSKATAMIYSNLLIGVTTATTISPTDGSYTNFILANGSHGVAFYSLSEAGELAAGKAYLQLPTASVPEVKAIRVIFDDDEDAIQSIAEESQTERIYNLQGQQVNAPKSGLYIVNGKKVFIK